MVLEGLLQENTHFNQELEPANVTGYGDEFGMIQSMIEAAQCTQDTFEQIVNVGFAEAAAMHNIGTFSESTVMDMINEDAENASSDKTDSKKGGIISTVIEGLKKLWSAFLNAVNTVINTIKTYVARDLKKFAQNTKLKSDAELAKIKIKKIKWVKTEELLDLVGEPVEPNYMGMSKEQLSKAQSDLKDNAKEIIKKMTDIDADSIKELYAKIIDKCTETKTYVPISELIDAARITLVSANDDIEAFKKIKKGANDSYKKAINDVKSKAKTVKKSGSLSDEQGNTTKISDKDQYALASKVTLEHMKLTHNITMTTIKALQKLTMLDISNAKSIYVKAAQGKLGNKTSDDSKASDEVENANESALFEYCEYDTELDMEQIQEQIESGEIDPSDFE